MSEPNLIKVLLKSECPHCLGEIFVEVESPAPIARGVLRMADITTAKENVIKKITELLTNEEIEKVDFDQAVEWINDSETVFGPSDVEAIIESIKN